MLTKLVRLMRHEPLEQLEPLSSKKLSEKYAKAEAELEGLEEEIHKTVAAAEQKRANSAPPAQPKAS